MSNRKILSLAVLLLTTTSSCAVSMKMQGNRFESSEVYGKTAARIDTAVPGRSNVELTPDYTYTAPSTTNPTIGPNHDAFFGANMGIKDRIEIGVNTNWIGHAKFQILGAPKIRAEDGNFSLSAVMNLGFNSDDQQSTGISNNLYKSHLEYTTYGGQLVAGYRADRILNFYAGPFVERGDYKGTYEIVNVSNVAYSGNATNVGGVVGIEIGSPRVTGMLEGAWNHTTAGSSKASFWVAGAQVIISFGSTKESSSSSGYDGRSGF